MIKLILFEGDRILATGKKNRTPVDFSAMLRIDATVMRSLARATTPRVKVTVDVVLLGGTQRWADKHRGFRPNIESEE